PDSFANSAFDSEKIYRRLIRSTTWIVTVLPNGMSFGSGSLVDKKNKLILTNHHVVNDHLANPRHRLSVFFAEFDDRGEPISAKKYYLDKLKNNQGLPARVVYHDQKRDLALVQLFDLPEGANVVPLAPRSPSPGNQVLSVGNPDVGALWVVTKGSVR